MTRFLPTRWLLIALICAGMGTLAAADTAPVGEILLSIAGTSPDDGHAIAAEYDLAALQALPKTSFTTTTTWTTGPQHFDGVSLKVLLDSLGVTKGVIVATAINQYRVEIPLSDAVTDGPIIAYALNGVAMSVRDKGPLWVVYPYDQFAQYQTEVVYSRSIWQLDHIGFAP